MNKKLVTILMFVCLFAMVTLCFTNEEEKTYIKYSEFVQYVNNAAVEKVQIENETITFFMKKDENLYYTENPEYEGFKEFLLLNNIEIIDTFGYDDVAFILDLCFYIFFIGIIVFGSYKIYSFTNKSFKIIKNNATKFEDIAGLDGLKRDLLKEVDVLKNSKQYREKGIRPAKGIILEGPPGNGKTLIAKALAGESNINFIATKGADFQSAMMSVGPRKIKALFRKARKHKPCIIFIDEFDGIGEKRNYAGTGIDKENNRMIIAMLNEMDGFLAEEGVLVIAATNSYASLDPALIRPGRFDKKYKIGNPDIKTIIELINLYTKNKKIDGKINTESLAKCFEGLSSAAIETIINEATLQAETKYNGVICMEDIVQAGKITNTVNIKIK